MGSVSGLMYVGYAAIDRTPCPVGYEVRPEYLGRVIVLLFKSRAEPFVESGVLGDFVEEET